MRKVTVGHFESTPRIHEYVTQVLNSGRLSYGPFTQRFEAEWARRHECKYALFCNSGTSALHVALQALKEHYDWDNDAEVIVPATTFVATSNVVLHNNLKLVFADVDPLTYNISPSEIRNKLTNNTRAIIPVHLTGQPADMEAIRNIASWANLKIIEDSCETTFAMCNGRTVGSWGDIGCFSTYMAHYIVTGVGGFATTSDPDLAYKMRSLMNHGRDGIYYNIDTDDNLSGDQLKDMMSRRFKFERVGHSFRATELEAAIGLAQMEKADSIVRRRTEIASSYSAGLVGLADKLQLPYVQPGRNHVFMMYPLVCREEGIKEKLTLYLEEAGVETRDLLPLVNQPVYANFGDLASQFPVSASLVRNAFYIGCHQYITNDDVVHVIQTIHKFFDTV
jgi:dTDP-4-amino-4,6-dideoxygalactose transaminase